MKKRAYYFELSRHLFFAAVLLFVSIGLVKGQEVSRWALGRPALLIDMPADPGAGGVAWAERPMYSIFPNAWSAEGSGVRIEVARIYTPKDPAALMAEIGQKANVSMTPAGRGQISGREFVRMRKLT